jgi:hypothetical protein
LGAFSMVAGSPISPQLPLVLGIAAGMLVCYIMTYYLWRSK